MLVLGRFIAMQPPENQPPQPPIDNPVPLNAESRSYYKMDFIGYGCLWIILLFGVVPIVFAIVLTAILAVVGIIGS